MTQETAESFVLTSTAFENGGAIPAHYTCQGANVSPPLSWHGAPAGTQSFTLIVEDPDAPDPAAARMTWVHWVLYDIPPTVFLLSEGAAAPAGARNGLNDWQRTGYGGPCPPMGRHRYFFRLYALDTLLGNLDLPTRVDSPTKAQLEKAMHGRVLGEATLIGTYAKHGDDVSALSPSA